MEQSHLKKFKGVQPSQLVNSWMITEISEQSAGGAAVAGPAIPPNGPEGSGRWRICLHMWWMSQQLAIKANVVLMCLCQKTCQ